MAALIAFSSANAASVANCKITGGGQQRPPPAEHHHQVLAQGMPIKADTCSSSALASSLKPRGRKLRPSTLAGSGSLEPVSIRRAGERPIPVVVTTRSRISPLSAFDALPVRGPQLVDYLPPRSHIDLAFHIGQAFRATGGHALKIGEAPPPTTRSN